MDYQLIRSNRKTVCIQLSSEGALIVRAPRRCPRAYIDAFVESKADWITAHQGQVLERNARRDAFRFREGDRFSLCGETVTVQIRPGCPLELKDGVLSLPEGDISGSREAILRRARLLGGPWLRERLDRWAGQMGLAYRALKFSTARTRWGSCSRDGVIRISLWLLFAPEKCIDYVLIHELSHLRHFDHSPAFWAEVERVLPDWKARRKALRLFQDDPFLQALAKREKRE